MIQPAQGTPGALGYDQAGNLMNGNNNHGLLFSLILGALQLLTGGGSGGSGGIKIASPSAGLTISDTSAHTGTFNAITIVSDAVFTALTGTITGYGTITYPAGITLYGSFTSITLASGVVVAYSP